MKLSGAKRGYTLLEVLLAVGLSVLLLSAVYAALDLHWRYSRVGRAETERAQVVRALAKMLRADVHSVVFQSAEDAERQLRDQNVLPQIEVVRPDDIYRAGRIGIVGNRERLLLEVPNHATAPGSSYGTHLAEWTIAKDKAIGHDSRRGIARIVGNSPLRRKPNDPSARTAQQPTDRDTNILAEEVQAVRFRYFDGEAWYANWDSTLEGQLPRAVEATLELKSAEALPNTITGPLAQRIVVAVPLSEPGQSPAPPQ